MIDRSKIILIEKLIILSNILIVFWVYTDILIEEDTYSMLMALCLVSLCIFFLYVVWGKLNVAHMVVIFIAAFTFIAFIAHAFGYVYMKRWMMFVAFLFYAAVCISIKVSDRTLLWITRLNTLQALLLLCFAFFPDSYSVGILQYCYNPNSASLRLMYLFITSVIAQLTFGRNLHKYFRMAWYLLNAGLCICIYLTGSRGMLVGLITFFVVLILYRKATCNPCVKVNSKLIAVCIVFPLVFVLIYYLLVKDKPDFDIQLFGYTISTRNDMWFSVIRDFKNNWFWGNYYKNQGMPHNGYIDMINAYGYLITAAFMWLIYRCIKKINQGGWINVVIIAGLIALILQATGEAASFMGDYRGIMIANLFLFRVEKERIPYNSKEIV